MLQLMITDLTIKNFKSIGEDGVKIELKPLTIFLGPNGSGKSSILEAIGILSQSAEKTNFQTNGNLVRIPLASDIFYKRSSDNWLTFEINIKATDAEINKLITISKNELSNDIQEALYKRDIKYKLSYKWKTNEFNQTIIIGNQEIAKAELIKVGEGYSASKLEFPDRTSSSPWVGANQILNEQVFRDQEKKNEERYLFSWDEIPGNDSIQLIDFLNQKFGIDWVKTAKIEKIDNDKIIKVYTKKNHILLKLNNNKTKLNLEIDDVKTDALIAKTENDKLNIYEEGNIFSDIAMEIVRLLKTRLLNQVFLISAIRGQTEFEEKIIGDIDTKSLKVSGVGTYGRYLIPVLSLIYSNREYEKVYGKIDKWATNFGLNKFSAGWKGGLALGSDYVDNRLDVVLNLAMASHGSKQILSVITQLFWSESGTIIMIEEPEISLHPDSQAHLVELFAEAIREDKQIIITTHSEFIPLTLSIPIQKGLLKIDDIAVYHVEKGQKGTAIKRLELTSKGYVKGWIPSFAELEERLLKEWLETVPEE